MSEIGDFNNLYRKNVNKSDERADIAKFDQIISRVIKWSNYPLTHSKDLKSKTVVGLVK